MSGVTKKVRVTLRSLSDTRIPDVDGLLTPPNGARPTLFMSDIGNATPIAPPGVTVTFDDQASSQAPVGAPLKSGTFKPTNGDMLPDVFAAPAPGAPYSPILGSANGFNPNGVWSIYLSDDNGSGTHADRGAVQAAWLTVNTKTVKTPKPPRTHHRRHKCKHRHRHRHHKRRHCHRRHRHHKHHRH
jgi:hypothetical protein